MKIGVSLILILCSSLFALQEIERYAIIVGVNYGGAKRDLLKYAHTDAQNVGRVLTEIGGVPKENQTMLLEPSAEKFNSALTDLSARLDGLPTKNRREIVLYFSGHANENGLFFGNDNYDYRVLRKDIDKLPAQLKVTILDACASGAITQMKGGYRKQAFLVDASNDLSGYAFITSSSNTEASQESEAIGGSFFTHYLVSGMRGAADVSRDGRITLGEAYQFAFNETLNRTQNTSGGAQHPSYDMKLSGSGDVVMSDLRNNDKGIVFGKNVAGRIFVKSKDGTLVTEMYKAPGRIVELGLSNEVYTVVLENDTRWKKATADLKGVVRVILSEEDFTESAVEDTRLRGGGVSTENIIDSTSVSAELLQTKSDSIKNRLNVGSSFSELGTWYIDVSMERGPWFGMVSFGYDPYNKAGGNYSGGVGLGYSSDRGWYSIKGLLQGYWLYCNYEPNGHMGFDGAGESTSWYAEPWDNEFHDEFLARVSGIVDVDVTNWVSFWFGASANLLANFDHIYLARPWGGSYGRFYNVADGLYMWPGAQVGLTVNIF
ncbi:MAG: caspase family protein [Fibrobacterales bacterium]